jgi:type IV secretory pathway VirB9-like protein
VKYKKEIITNLTLTTEGKELLNFVLNALSSTEKIEDWTLEKNKSWISQPLSIFTL